MGRQAGNMRLTTHMEGRAGQGGLLLRGEAGPRQGMEQCLELGGEGEENEQDREMEFIQHLSSLQVLRRRILELIEIF